MRCPRGSDDSSFFVYTPVYIKNELGLGESGAFLPQSAVLDFMAAARYRDKMWALEQYLKVWKD